MGGRLALALLLLGACNAELNQHQQLVTPVDSGRADAAAPINSAPDAMVDAGPAWGTRQPIVGASSTTLQEDDGTPNQALTELYFAIVNTGTGKDLYWMTRKSPSDPWGVPVVLVQNNGNDESPRLSLNELTLYFGENGDIYEMTRAAPDSASPWSTPTIVPNVNVVGNATYEKWLAVCANDYYMVSRNNDLYEGTLGSAPTIVTSLSTADAELSTWLSADCLTVMFARFPQGGHEDIYISHRASMSDPWPAATPLGMFNTPNFNEEDPWESNDQHTFVFASNALGTKDLYMSTR
jgi:hypothetical protein